MQKNQPGTQPKLPRLKLLMGPAGSGKTEACLKQILDREGHALMIVPSSEHADTLASKLAERISIPLIEARTYFSAFHNLASQILQSSPGDVRSISRSLQRLIITDVFQQNTREDDFFGKMLSTPGFIPALIERIRELKLACITPEDLNIGLNTSSILKLDKTSYLKISSLIELFRQYEEFLQQNHFIDEEDSLRLAGEKARQSTILPLETKLLVVDGFYRFTRSQRKLLAALAGRRTAAGDNELELIVTLPIDVERPLLSAAPQRTLDRLRTEFDTQETLLTASTEAQSSSLFQLSSGIFASNPNILTDDTSAAFSIHDSRAPISFSSELQIFDAPNPYVEVEMTAREFSRLYATGEYKWDDFSVILRTKGDYAPILSAVFERCAIPLGMDGPEKLSENPLLKTILHLLSIVRYGWQREDLLAFLKSSYTKPDKLEADLFRRRAKISAARERRERWMKMISAQTYKLPESIHDTINQLSEFDAMLNKPVASPIEFVERIRSVVSGFGLETRIQSGEKLRAERDWSALKTGFEVLDSIAEMLSLRDRNSPTFSEFHDELISGWGSSTASGGLAVDQVRVTDPYDARERPIRIAAIMGLTERVFPRRISEDPFLRDEERRELQLTADLDLEEQKHRTDDERFLFYLAVSAPTERLILSYPRSSQEADTLPSFYIDEVRAVFERAGKQAGGDSVTILHNSCPTVIRTLADVAPRIDEAVKPKDRILASCADLFDPGSESDIPLRKKRMLRAAHELENCLADPAELFITNSILNSRSLPRLHRFHDSGLKKQFCSLKSVYAIKELETYGKCGFQYLMRHGMDIRPESDGLDADDQSALIHTALRLYYRKRAKIENNLIPKRPETDSMITELTKEMTALLQRDDIDASPHQLRIVERRLFDDLKGYALRENTFGPQFEMNPSHFNIAFGLEIFSSRHDVLSCDEPLTLKLPGSGESVRVSGCIDRLDLNESSDRALVLDYDSGRATQFSEIQGGRSLQMPLYMLAVERLFGKIGAAACYDSMRETGRNRFHRAEHLNIRQFQPILPQDDTENVKPLNRDQYIELTRIAETKAILLVQQIEEGRVEATPGTYCKYCAYRDVCRTSSIDGHDGEPLV